jgi:hypothetical protein
MPKDNPDSRVAPFPAAEPDREEMIERFLNWLRPAQQYPIFKVQQERKGAEQIYCVMQPSAQSEDSEGS